MTLTRSLPGVGEEAARGKYWDRMGKEENYFYAEWGERELGMRTVRVWVWPVWVWGVEYSAAESCNFGGGGLKM